MSIDRQNEHDIDRLLKRTLRDDLPSDAEFVMRKRLAVFRRALESSDDTSRARSLWSWICPPVRERSHRWLGVFRKEALACVSAAMLAAGAVIHLGGFQSLLADSISLLKMSMLLTERVRLAGSMDCLVRTPVDGTQATTIQRIRWVRDGRTRVDIVSPRGVTETLWIIQGRVTIAGSAAGMPPAASPALGLQEPVTALLSPADLARRLDESRQRQPENQQHHPDRLVFIGRQDRAVIEVYFDKKSFLPVSLNWRAPKSNEKGGAGGAATTVEFKWNQPVAPELMVPGLRPGM